MEPGTEFTQTMDAVAWAKAWIDRASLLRRDQILDEGWMTGWFANAIMRGYDTGYAKGRDDEANDVSTETT